MRAGIAFAAVAAACAAAPAQQNAVSGSRAIALRNAGFEAPARAGARCPEAWSCTMHADPDSFRFALDRSAPAEGAQSLCIERVTHEPWAVASQSVPAEAWRGRRLRFSVTLRGERLDGPGGGPWIVVNGAMGMLVHEQRVTRLGPAWERQTVEFDVPAQAQALEVGATLEGGGRLCVDDARLEPV